MGGQAFTSQTFIIVDRLPDTSKTREAAAKIGAEIIQMSIQYWPRDLAQRLEKRMGYKHLLCSMPDAKIGGYLRAKMPHVSIENFLAGLSPGDNDDFNPEEE